MRKENIYIVLTLLCVQLSSNLNAQTWQWVNRIGTGASVQQDRPDEQIFDMKVDIAGNVYTCGRVLNSGFINDTIPYTTYGGYDIFIAKYNCHGDLLWYQTAGSASFGDEARSLLLDSAGNIFITGRVISIISSSRCNFLGTLLGDVADMFICKLDPNGNLIWLKTGGNSLTHLVSIGEFMKFDRNGNLSIEYFSSAGLLFPGFNIINGRHVGTFRISDGVMIKDVPFNNYVPITDFDVDSLNNYYLIGTLSQDSAVMGTQSIYHINPNRTYPEMFLFKLDSSGNTVWLRNFGDPINPQFLKGGGIIHQKDGTIIISSSSQNGINYDGHFSNNTANNFAQYPMVAKLDSLGQFLWVTNPIIQFTGESFRGLAIRSNGNILFSGFFTGAATFGSSTLSSTPPTDLFLGEVSNSGQILNGIQFTTASTSEKINSIVVDGNDDVYVAGAFDGTLTLAGQTYICQGGNGDCFFAKYGSTCVTGLNNTTAVESQISISPNPVTNFINLKSELYSIINITIYNTLGQAIIIKDNLLSKNVQLDLTDLNAGIYVVNVMTTHGVQKKKLLKE